MSKIKLTSEIVEAAVLGGCVLGGGGGGSMDEGRKIGMLAVNLSSPELVDIEDINENALLINVAAVGAPSAKDAYAEPVHYMKAIELVQKVADIKIEGIISNEAGGLATVNGWLQAAMLGIPVVDAPCNGRAHPTGIMGAMGLHKNKDYKAIQAAVGGAKERATYTEVVAIGSIEKASAIVRVAAVQAGGLVAVARNPISCQYAKENAALGAVKQAINLGKKMIEAKEKGATEVINTVCDFLGGELITTAVVENIHLESVGGFDVGRVILEDDFEITFWNEYMTLEKKGERIATFPDLIMTLNTETGMPVTSAEIKMGQKIALIKVKKEKIKLGAGMKDPALFKACEEAVGKKIIEYVF
ncbi:MULTISPECIES: DUF917 domain-containing protein [Thermoanaerobacter]|uniref:DUF917 domain-containing protein n=1 Tax=Thermoanaerobacter TaxID=1754 RepID=UPI000575C5AD|nr:DUF917 family protein [Thermoanaerobacter sp. YS13]KHO62776.1 OsrF [Thermoanaerobacter sp. YS13]